MKRHFQTEETREATHREGEEIGHIGDVHWAEYGGGPVFCRSQPDQTDIFGDCYLEYVEPPTDDVEFGDPEARWTVYSVELTPEVPSWGSITDVARSAGQDPRELREAFVSPDPMQRAWAYETWAGHYGWHEFDSYALQLTCVEMNERYDADLDCGGDDEEDEEEDDLEESVDDGFYIVQGAYNNGRVTTEIHFDDEEEAVREAKRLLRSNYFEGDNVRVITVDGELVWEG